MVYLIDTENISLGKLLMTINPEKKDRIYFFYSEFCPAVPMELLEELAKKKVKVRFKEAIVGKPNALDFQMVSYLGFILRRSFKKTEVSIVSSDKAFDCVAEFWNRQGYSVKTIKPKREHTEKNRKMVSLQKQDLNGKLAGNIRSNRERWEVVNYIMDAKNGKSDINKFLTHRYSGKTLRNINNIIKPYIANRAS